MTKQHRILGIVLAAGRSERMGRPKALLRVGDVSFLRKTVEALEFGGCDEVVAVVPGDLEAEARSAGARAVVNRAVRSEQVESLRLGLAAAGAEVAAVVVMPVDHPLVRGSTVAKLIEAHLARPDAVVRPTRGGRPGHPTLFPRVAWPALMDPSLGGGARSVVESPEQATVDVEVDDDGVLADIDTPESYREHLGDSPEDAP